MRLTKEKAAENRARVVQEAARLFGSRGVDNVGVADLMAAAGFTHGGFYNHFGSKQELAAEAVAYAFDEAVGRLQRRAHQAVADGDSREALERTVAGYLSAENRDAPGPACPMAALGTDAARQGAGVRDVFEMGTKRYIEALAELVQQRDGTDLPEARRTAIAMIAALIGGLTLARAAPDVSFSDEIFAAVKQALAAPATSPG